MLQTNYINHTKEQSIQRSWAKAYKSFLLSRDESFVLKIAPIVLIFGAPEIIVSNILPVIGEAADIGGLTLTAIVASKTFSAVKKYR